MNHILKLNTTYWDAIASGQKTFEVRRDDRGFQKGDTVTLCRWGKAAPNAVGNAYLKTLPNGVYWGTETPEDCDKMTFEIAWILTGGQFGIEPGYVVLSIKKPQGAVSNSATPHSLHFLQTEYQWGVEGKQSGWHMNIADIGALLDVAKAAQRVVKAHERGERPVQVDELRSTLAALEK